MSISSPPPSTPSSRKATRSRKASGQPDASSTTSTPTTSSSRLAESIPVETAKRFLPDPRFLAAIPVSEVIDLLVSLSTIDPRLYTLSEIKPRQWLAHSNVPGWASVVVKGPTPDDALFTLELALSEFLTAALPSPT